MSLEALSAEDTPTVLLVDSPDLHRRDVTSVVGDGARFAYMCLGKPVFAAAVLCLAHDNRLSLDDPITRYVSGVRSLRDVTIHGLLTHRSQIGRDFPPLASSDERLIRWIDASPRTTEATPEYAISVPWFLLGKVVEKVACMPRAEALRSLVLDPLGLEMTLDADGEVLPVYSEIEGPRELVNWPADPAVRARSLPGTGLVGTAESLLRFFSALRVRNRGEIPDSLDFALDQVALTRGQGLRIGSSNYSRYRYGYGTFVGGEWIGQKSRSEVVGFNAATGSFAFVDLARDISVVHLRTMMERAPMSFRRRKMIGDAVYRGVA